MSFPGRACLPLLLLGLGGCRPVPRSATTAAADSAFTGTSPILQVRVPARWEGRYETDTLSTQERGSALAGAREYYYRPRDPHFHREVLAVAAVYDSGAWRAALAEGGPPPGDSVGARAGLVYVIGLPQSNPFPKDSPDAASFDSLQLGPSEAASFIRIE